MLTLNTELLGCVSLLQFQQYFMQARHRRCPLGGSSQRCEPLRMRDILFNKHGGTLRDSSQDSTER